MMPWRRTTGSGRPGQRAARVVVTALFLVAATAALAAEPEEDPEVVAPKAPLGMQQESALSSKAFNFSHFKNQGSLDKASPLQKSFDPGTAAGFDKPYLVKDGKVVLPQSPFADMDFPVQAAPGFTDSNPEAMRPWEKASPLGTRDSAMSSKRAAGFNRRIETPVYLGPEKERIKNELDQVNSVLMSQENLPEKSLSIAEIKKMLNEYSGKSAANAGAKPSVGGVPRAEAVSVSNEALSPQAQSRPSEGRP